MRFNVTSILTQDKAYFDAAVFVTSAIFAFYTSVTLSLLALSAEISAILGVVIGIVIDYGLSLYK